MGFSDLIGDWLFKKAGISMNYTPVLQSESMHYVLAILLKLSQIDGDSSPTEMADIIALTSSRFGDDSGKGIVAVTEAFEKTKARDSKELISILSAKLSLEQKTELLELAYLIARVEKGIDSEENKFISHLAQEFKVPHDLMVDAYKNALEKRAKK